MLPAKNQHAAAACLAAARSATLLEHATTAPARHRRGCRPTAMEHDPWCSSSIMPGLFFFFFFFDFFFYSSNEGPSTSHLIEKSQVVLVLTESSEYHVTMIM